VFFRSFNFNEHGLEQRVTFLDHLAGRADTRVRGFREHAARFRGGGSHCALSQPRLVMSEDRLRFCRNVVGKVRPVQRRAGGGDCSRIHHQPAFDQLGEGDGVALGRTHGRCIIGEEALVRRPGVERIGVEDRGGRSAGRCKRQIERRADAPVSLG